MKRILSMVTACMMLMSVVISASAETSGSGSTEPVKLTALIVKNSLTKDVNDMEWIKELEASCNVEIVDWQQYIDADWAQKKATIFASGDVPDLLFNATTSNDFDMYKGLFEELTPLIDQYGTNIQKMFAEQPETLIRATDKEGKIYGVGNYNAEQVTVHGSMFINKQWLDALGLSVPTTWDELYDVLVAFRDDDPNGNGDTTDETPFDFWQLSTYGAINLLGSTGIQMVGLSSGNTYFAEDGIVKNFYIDDRFKELITYLHKLYAEGLINPETFTQDFSSMVSLAAGTGNGVARVGMQIFWDIPSIFGTDIADQYIVLPPLKVSATSTDDVRYEYETFKVFSSSRFAISMSANCSDKEAAMRFLDAFYASKASAETLYGGVTDGQIIDAGDGTYTVLDPTDPSFSGTIWMWTNTLGPIGPYYVYDGLLNNAPDTDNAKIEKSVYDEAHSRIDFTKDFFGYMYFKMDAADIDTISLNAANFQIDWVNWIMNGGVDEAWDAHVQSMIDNGLMQNIEIYQKYYDDYVASVN